MNNLDETNILTTRPSIITIGFGLFGTIFFGAFVYLMLTSKWTVEDGTNEKTGMIIMWTLTGLFVFFATACFSMILSIKVIVLTDQKLIIKRPLLLLRTTILLNNINNIRKGDYNINTTHGFIDYNIYNGEKIIIELKNKKEIKFNSFEISDYNKLIQNLQKLLRNKKNMDIVDNDSSSPIKNEGLGWLIFLVLLTFGLIISLIRHKFDN